MIDSVKGFTQVYKYAQDMVFISNGDLNNFYRVVYSMACGMRFSEAKLVFI